MPLNGRVAVVDDKSDEAVPLIQVLSKNKISAAYFSGEVDTLPESPLDNIRIIFMDLKLGSAATEPKTVVSQVLAVIKKLISDRNGPYALILWSKHDSHYKTDLETAFCSPDLQSIKPIVFLTMDKAEYIDRDEEDNVVIDDDALDKITNKLTDAAKKFNAFELFLIWENIVHSSAGEIVTDFSSFYPLDEEWNSKIAAILFQLAQAEIGKHVRDVDFKDHVVAAFNIFNQTFMDLLEYNIMASDYNDVKMSLQGIVEEGIKAKINTKLYLSQSQLELDCPGTLYIDSNKSRFSTFSQLVYDCLDMKQLHEVLAKKLNVNCTDLYEDGKLKRAYKKPCSEYFHMIETNSESVFLEVTPSCDFAQKKWTMNRILPGFKINSEYKDLIKKADYIYKTPIFEIDNKTHVFILDLRYMTSMSKVNFNNLTQTNDVQKNYRIRHSLLTDIQSHLARHINRPGIQSL